ncbi:bifunctional serine/threonine-protein kinase/formylglycine-generating enzyme family protein [Lysobacter sp. Root916]|uniref:bifunctional serine/threonine-protein kinase/formylglycine-generating enzyme family protein n=1 Tax=Lysobacter sp. Root916 TaxID=1736606 RepID=UPI0009ECB0EF|nr:bifunctional serine/threonine-protein kinase/formylglycine-generating enzyme family protein [Lysobacter sp. Root916]
MSRSTQNPHEDSAPLPEIAGYRLRRVINHGGMSTVYLGEQIGLAREVAIKVMLPLALSDEVSRRRFENEVRTIARLEHPNVVVIHEVGRTREGLPYYAMPYLARGHLGQRDLSKDEPRAISIMETLLSALDYAHARGVVHRDVKAENVLFDDAERPLLADFGIALRRGFGPRVTAAGLAVGSTAYMAPEQARGEDVDGRADLYSLGVLGWEMLTGRLPFEAADALSMAVMHAQDPIPKLPQHLRHWQRFMNRALAKQPGQRFQDAAEMTEALADVQRSGFVHSLKRLMPRRNRLRQWAVPLWAGVAVAAVAVVAIGFGLSSAQDDEFFRVERAAAAPASAVASPAAGDPTDAMLAPLPEAPLQRSLEEARRYIRLGKLTAPADGNAYNSLLTAWHADSTSPDVRAGVTELTRALGDQLAAAVRERNDQRAREHMLNATTLAQQTGSADSPAMRALREQAVAALQARIELDGKRNDREDAQRSAALAAELDLPKATSARLIAQAKAIGGLRAGETVAVGSLTQDNSRITVALSPRPVSRAEYARFASASNRSPALCRERASLLRVLAPRNWESPGFKQGDGEPVVCVSQADAEAYAQWYSQQTGRRYRLPSAAEAENLNDTPGRALSMWLRDCGRDCQQRQASGASWRSRQAQRPLAAARGYDDVGFRLVRER